MLHILSVAFQLRANQQVTAEDFVQSVRDGSLDSASALRRYSVSLLSKEQARTNVVMEIVHAEREYVKRLKDVVDVSEYLSSESSIVLSQLAENQTVLVSLTHSSLETTAEPGARNHFKQVENLNISGLLGKGQTASGNVL